jgi:uncharacterized protein YjbI with pentapeptide repeats
MAGADLADANLAGVDLHGADLAGANLIRADLTAANLTGVLWSGGTLWPEDTVSLMQSRSEELRPGVWRGFRVG